MGLMRVLMITSDFPTPGKPRTTHFVKRQADFLTAAGVDVDVLHFQGEKKLRKYAVGWLEARRRLRAEAYDLVHAQFGQSGLLALPKRLPLVVTLRGSDLLGIVDDTTGRYGWRSAWLQRATRHVARRADAVIVVSRHMAPLLETEAPVHLIPSGLDLALFRPGSREEARQRLGLDPAERLVLFAGRPTQARKRFDLAQQAVERLGRAIPARLVVAWGVMHDRMPDYMNACDVLVCTSMQEGRLTSSRKRWRATSRSSRCPWATWRSGCRAWRGANCAQTTAPTPSRRRSSGSCGKVVAATDAPPSSTSTSASSPSA
jgi:glycosyltransferase involved in cell wall biosynthesis